MAAYDNFALLISYLGKQNKYTRDCVYLSLNFQSFKIPIILQYIFSFSFYFFFENFLYIKLSFIYPV